MGNSEGKSTAGVSLLRSRLSKLRSIEVLLIAFGLILVFHDPLSKWVPARLDYLAILGVGLVVLGVLLPRTWPLSYTQAAMVCIGLGLAAVHAIGEHVWPPAIDASTYAGIGIAVAGLILPRVKGLKFGDTSVDLGEEVLNAADFTYAQTSEFFETATLSISSLNRQLQLAKSTEAAVGQFIRFATDLLADSLSVFSFEGEIVRLSVWLYREDKDQLEMLVSNDEERNKSQPKGFAAGEGLIGQAWVDNAVYQTDDAPNEPFYVRSNGEKSAYKGLLLMPIRFGNNSIFGVLSIDRTAKTFFPEQMVSLAGGVAHLLGLAMSHPGLRRWITLLPALEESQLPVWPIA